ncbi:hypothetical protein [Arsenophonus sp.]|uniref:hypothetical protein n=1 Tax=Arsenophonus sp. TaxID=1872640 RepID=UPI00285DAD5D|nr:hypothetical protein [Arsenophonus sp.]MDR5617066.1 hypothetical protein [Arsenophonus sp.]
MIIDRALSTELNTELKLINNNNSSIINNIINDPENYVSFSDKGKLLLSIITLGISHVVIHLIEDHRKEKSRAECIAITKNLLSSLNSIENQQSEEKVIFISLSKGERLKLTQRFSNNENRYETIIEYKKVRVFHLGQYNESKSYVNKTFEEIKKLLVSDILAHEYDYTYKDESLLTIAKNIKQKLDDNINNKEHNGVVLKINNPNEPIIYNQKSIGAKLRETYQEGYTSLSFIEKKNNFTNKKHLILGIVSPSKQVFLLSPASGDDKNIYYDTNIRYVKLNLTSKTKLDSREKRNELIKEFYESLITKLENVPANSVCIENIIKSLCPTCKISTITQNLNKKEKAAFLENINHGVLEQTDVIDDSKQLPQKLIATKESHPQVSSITNTLTSLVTKKQNYNEALNPFSE